MEENTSFEDKKKKLEEIANELEKGELNLDDSVSKFEEGTEHLSLRPFCGSLRGSLLLQHQNDRIS